MIIGFIRDYKERGERFNLEGVKVIKRAKSEVQAKKTVNIAVLNCLNSLEDFWNTNIFYSKLVLLENKYCDVLVILEKGLKYFCDKRKKNFELSDCEEKIQEIKDELKRYIVKEKDAEDIKKLNETRLLIYLYHDNTPMPVKVLFDYIDYQVRYMELADRYEGENNKVEIFRLRFVKDTIQQIGISHSYMAQIMYNKILDRISYMTNSDEDMEEVIINLEIYRCIVKESTASEEELRFRYSPCI